MFIDLGKERPGGPLKTDIAVVGSGPAGLTIARRLQSLGRDALLLASGTCGYTKRAQTLNDGDDALGRTSYLRTSRVRAFGGTSFHWVGWCAPLDPVDFAERAWIKHSGWPISKADLTSCYAAASEICELDKLGFEVERWAKLRKQQPLSWNGDEFSTAYFQLSPPTRFGKKYRPEVEASRKITAVLNATGAGVRLESNGGSCKGLFRPRPHRETNEGQGRPAIPAGG